MTVETIEIKKDSATPPASVADLDLLGFNQTEANDGVSQVSEVPISRAQGRRVAIGTKFIILISGLLAITLISFLYNAAHLFKKDNLDSIYLFTDILNASKAGEVRSWLESAVARVKLLGNQLDTSNNPTDSTATLTAVDSASAERDILLLSRFTFKRVAHSFDLKSETPPWKNQKFLIKTRLSIDSLQSSLRQSVTQIVFRETGLNPGRQWVSVQSFRVPEEKNRFFLVFPYSQHGSDFEYIGAILDETALAQVFDAEGPYQLILLDYEGRVLAATATRQDLTPDELAELPFTRHLLTSKLDREFQEFGYHDQSYLGAYQRLGVGGMSVLSWVPKDIALETGDVLIRRTVLIGLLLFLGAFILSFLFVEQLVQPILKLCVAAKKMAQGNFSTRVSVRTSDEILDLAESFNVMSSEVEQRIINLYRINEASVKIRSIQNIQELLDYSIDFLSSLLDCPSGLGVFLPGQKKSEFSKIKSTFSKKNWTYDLNLKTFFKGLENSREIDQMRMVDRSFLVCPILHQDKIKGLVVLAGKSKRSFFGAEEIAMARTVMTMISADSENLQYQNELRELNADLESRVRLRTLELAQQKKELEDVMNNIQQAILTLDDQGTINSEYSKFSTELFGRDDISHLNVTDLIFSEEQKELGAENLSSWLQSVFADPDSFELIQDFALKDHEYFRMGPDGNVDARQIHIEWKPIYEDSRIIKLMLVCFDLTEQKRLEKEIQRQDEIHKEELEIIAQLVNNPAGVVDQFISDFTRNLNEGTELFSSDGAASSSVVARGLARVLHTLKGSIKQFGLHSVQMRVHDLEENVARFYRQFAKSGVQGEGQTDFFTRYEELRSEFKIVEDSLHRMIQVYQKIMSSKAPSSGSGIGGQPTVSIPANRIDRVLKDVFEGSGVIQKVAARKAVEWLLLAPVSSLFDRLESLAHSLAEELHYSVEVIKKGEDTKIDLRILPLLYDALIHVVRNTLDHGGELPEDRQSHGKPGALRLALTARLVPPESSQEPKKVNILIEDDGKGIDQKAVLKKAMSHGIIEKATAKNLTEKQIINLIFLPGFSTKEQVSDLSGRGVGMDVVKETVETRLGGQIEMSSQLGKGTRLELVVNQIS